MVARSLTQHGPAQVETLDELFVRRRPADPAATLLETLDGARLTYGEAWERSGQLAQALRGLGVGAGDRVAVQVEKSPLMVLLYLACVRTGAVLVPLNPAYTDDEVAYLLGDAEPTVFVCDPPRVTEFVVPKGTTVLTADADGAGSLSDLADGQMEELADISRSPDDLAALVYTSGTTGRPKGAMLTHRNLASNAVALCQVWGFRPDDVLLHALPLFHVHGLFVALNCVLASGSRMIFLPRFDPGTVLQQLPRCTVFMGVPTYYTRLLADPALDRDRCRDVRLFVSGSAPLLASTHEELRGRTGHVVVERYGMTETAIITSNPVDGERRPGTVGLPLPGVDVRIVASPTPAEDGEPRAGKVTEESPSHGLPQVVPAGTVGDVEVRGPNVGPGYWGRPELSAAERTDDGFFRTGDVGWLDPDGYLTLVARSKDVIISGGLNVYPKEVEEVLDQLDGVAESAVVAMPHPDFGEAVVAVVVPEPGQALDEAAIRATARRRLAAFKVPKRVHVVDALPRNTMGKVEKARLRATLPRL